MYIKASTWHTRSFKLTHSRLVEHGGGRNGPVPFADISTGRLICPLPLGGKAAVMAAQLSLNKKKNTQTNKSHPNNKHCISVCIASFGCRRAQVLFAYRSWDERMGSGVTVFSTAAYGSLMAKSAFSRSNIQLFSTEAEWKRWCERKGIEREKMGMKEKREIEGCCCV